MRLRAFNRRARFVITSTKTTHEADSLIVLFLCHFTVIPIDSFQRPLYGIAVYRLRRDCSVGQCGHSREVDRFYFADLAIEFFVLRRTVRKSGILFVATGALE